MKVQENDDREDKKDDKKDPKPAADSKAPDAKPADATTGDAKPVEPGIGTKAKTAGACGAKILPLSVGNSWSYVLIPAPLPAPPDVARIAPDAVLGCRQRSRTGPVDEIGAEHQPHQPQQRGDDDGADDEGERVDREGADAHEASNRRGKPSALPTCLIQTMRIRRGLGSRRLSCGCVAGVYETYLDEIVTIVDASDPSCANPAHHTGNVLPDTADRSHSSEPSQHPRR